MQDKFLHKKRLPKGSLTINTLLFRTMITGQNEYLVPMVNLYRS